MRAWLASSIIRSSLRDFVVEDAYCVQDIVVSLWPLSNKGLHGHYNSGCHERVMLKEPLITSMIELNLIPNNIEVV